MLFKDFAKLTRIEHSLFLAVAVIIGEIVVTRDIQVLPTLAGVLSVFFIGIGSFAINDALDYRIDKANKRKATSEEIENCEKRHPDEAIPICQTIYYEEGQSEQ